MRCNSIPNIEYGGKSTASHDSFSDYGQFAISQSAVGHIMYSAKTAQSTMDFSVMPIDDGVVDSPPNGGKCSNPVSSPSPLKIYRRSTSPQEHSRMNPESQRKLYSEPADELPALLVRGVFFYSTPKLILVTCSFEKILILVCFAGQ